MPAKGTSGRDRAAPGGLEITLDLAGKARATVVSGRLSAGLVTELYRDGRRLLVRVGGVSVVGPLTGDRELSLSRRQRLFGECVARLVFGHQADAERAEETVRGWVVCGHGVELGCGQKIGGGVWLRDAASGAVVSDTETPPPLAAPALAAAPGTEAKSPSTHTAARQSRAPRGARWCGRAVGRLLVLCYVSLVASVARVRQPVEVGGLEAGLAPAGPAPEERLQEQHGLRECQAGRGTFGLRRSRVNPQSRVQQQRDRDQRDLLGNFLERVPGPRRRGQIRGTIASHYC